MKLIKPILGAVIAGAIVLPLTSCVTKAKQETKVVAKTPVGYPALLTPGMAFASEEDDVFTLNNTLISSTWKVQEYELTGLEILNKVTSEVFELPKELFSITLKDGTKISSLDLRLDRAPRVVNILADDSSLKASARFAGKAIEANFKSGNDNLSVLWRAELRDEASYVRQVVTFTANIDDIDLETVTLISKKGETIKTAGSVQGSVVVKDNFFMAYEHPMANNGNGSSLAPVGTWSVEDLQSDTKSITFDVTNLIVEAGSYNPQIVSSGAKVNIKGAKLLEKGPMTLINDDRIAAADGHQGFTGSEENYWNIYNLNVKNYNPHAKYMLTILIEAADQEVLSGGSVAIDRIFTTPRVICSYTRNAPIHVDESYTASSVIGVTPKGQLRRGFLYYLERERVHPYRPFLNYNSWYDIGYFNKYNEADALAVIEGFGEELVNKRGVIMDSLLFDDGWDNDETLWKFHDGFPNGFTEVTKAANSYGIDPGIWLSPWGGYGDPRKNRVAAGRENGFEIYEDESNSYNSVFKMSGPKYYERFSTICKEMITKYSINQFKFDGIGGNSGSGADGFTPDFEAALKLIGELQDLRPDVYINLTTGTWPSPFWLQTCDSIWRGGYDHQFEGAGTKRQQWITYRDGEVYNRVVKNAPLFPISSLMVHGAILAKQAKDLDTASDKDLRDEIRSMFGAGSQLQELYITPTLMNQQNWDDLAEAAKWARKNAGTLVDVHWIGGNPYEESVYGFAAWSPEHSTLTLRNPSDKPQSIKFTIAQALELPGEQSVKMKVKCPFKIQVVDGKAILPQRIYSTVMSADKKIKLTLEPFEVLVFDLTPIVEIPVAVVEEEVPAIMVEIPSMEIGK